MERESAWKKYTKAQLKKVDAFAEQYRTFISDYKIEREVAAASIRLAEAAGYKPLASCIEAGTPLAPGDKVWADARGKAVILVHVGTEPMTKGMNILGAHIDSPRLDVKQNPLYEASDLALLDTHYYGGIKTYQWVTLPLAMHGVIAKKDGTVIDVVIGEDPADPVFCVSDLLIHLASDQMKKDAATAVEAEALDIIVGNRPITLGKASGKKKGAGAVGAAETAAAKAADDEAAKSPVKAFALQLLKEKYGIDEEDFLSAELEMVPAGAARDMGFDRSMILGYGQDDSVCAYPSLIAQLEVEAPKRTAVTVLVDKEEIGSVGATGMASLFFENTMAEVMELAGESGQLALRRALAASCMLSSDVNAGLDPSYASAFEEKNASYLGRGLVFSKFTGARGKSGSNDANAEYVARIRKVMDDAGVTFQLAELGKVNQGGGGTIAYLTAKYGMDVIDSGVAVLSMHAPWEVTSKADLYEAYRGYAAFLANMR